MVKVSNLDSPHAVADRPERPTCVSRREVFLSGLLVLIAFLTLNQARLWNPQRTITIQENVQVAEAQAWWVGRLDLPERKWDTALKDGRVYSYFPPMFTLLSAAIVGFCPDGVPHVALVILVVLVPLLGYMLFYQATGSARWGMVLAVGFMAGSSVWPELDLTLVTAKPYHVNHTLATIGLLIILIDYFGPRRVWLAGIGLFIAATSRQLTVMFAIPILYMAWTHAPRTQRWRRLGIAACFGAAVVVVSLGLNAIKFGHPLVTGYQLNHQGRDDIFAREARAHGILSPHWVPRNLYYTNVGLPQIHQILDAGEAKTILRPNNMGTGIWWMTPLLLWFWVDLRRIVQRRESLPILLGVLAVFGLLMFWHATGADQRGYNRYSLDYLPALLVLIAPHAIVGWRRWVTLAMIAWSLIYFHVLLPMPHVRIW
jgi:hypothetical protein